MSDEQRVERLLRATPDFYVNAGEAWECPCGVLKCGPITGAAVASILSECPGCHRTVEFVA